MMSGPGMPGQCERCRHFAEHYNGRCQSCPNGICASPTDLERQLRAAGQQPKLPNLANRCCPVCGHPECSQLGCGACDGGWCIPRRAEHNLAKRPTVEVRGAQEAVTVGPTEVLVITFPARTTAGQLETLRGRLLDSELRPGQILLVAGALSIAVIHNDPKPGNGHQAEKPAIDGVVIVDG